MKIILFALILLSLLPNGSCSQGANVGANSSRESPDSTSSELDPRIPPPALEKYQPISDARDWQNPYLLIEADGILLSANAAPGKNRMVSTDELARAVISLPVSAWPYGKVIGASQAGVVGSMNEFPRIKRNREEVEKVLKSLGLGVKWWPSN